ncbi:DUF2637 domain-containing protein [Streptomyces sp. CB02115]|uniref:DUF2637 domain-containing protein n=1 Tax=Streptomyces sp. CB02115 TaxID=1703939 RepID=UPI00093E791D|nr:DUF2637 domain-containing protein [Streptomyces sp. CB02115]OKJ46767.1 hypothetical protein AMK28_37580 [Streptomyces sp. CB02115]
MTTTIEPPVKVLDGWTPGPIPGAWEVASGTESETSGTEPGASTTSELASPGTDADVSRKVKVGLGVAAAGGGMVMGAIGFYLSFGNLSSAGHTKFGFSVDHAPFFAVGVDAAIVTCLVLDLFMATIRTSWPLLRVLAHGMTGASIYFNASAHGAITENVDKALAHGLMPVLFVIGVEAGRRILVQQAALPADHDTIPGHRWLLAGRSTWRIFKQMKVWDEPYSEVVARQRRRAVFNAWTEYKAEVAKAGLEQGSEEALARLPKKLEPFGLTVDEALALPDQMAREELRRQQEQEKRDQELELEKERAEHQAEKERLAHRKEMAALKADLSATEGVAGAQARGAVAEAEARADVQARSATALSDAVDSQEVAEANRRAAEAKAKVLEAEARSAEADRKKQSELARIETEKLRVLEVQGRAAEAEADAAEAKKRAAEARNAAAQIARRAVEAEDIANFTAKQRRVRVVARMLIAAGHDLDLAAIEKAIGVSTSTASTTKAEAIALMKAGYDPENGVDPEVPSRAEA